MNGEGGTRIKRPFGKKEMMGLGKGNRTNLNQWIPSVLVKKGTPLPTGCQLLRFPKASVSTSLPSKAESSMPVAFGFPRMR